MRKSFPLRIPVTLYLKIKQIAINNNRSMNKEIEFVLKQYTLSYEKQNGTINIDINALKQK